MQKLRKKCSFNTSITTDNSYQIVPSTRKLEKTKEAICNNRYIDLNQNCLQSLKQI